MIDKQQLSAMGEHLAEQRQPMCMAKRIEAVLAGKQQNKPVTITETIRTDKKRPFYPDEGLPDGLDPQNYSEHGSSVFLCRKCGEPVDETVPAAKYERVG